MQANLMAERGRGFTVQSVSQAFRRCVYSIAMWQVYGPALASALATSAVVFFFRPLARNFDFIDRPGGRKIHSDEVPVVGGLAMFIGLAVAVSLLPEVVRPPLTFISIAFVFVFLGLMDDRFSLSPGVRLIVQGGSAAAMALLGGLTVQFVGAPFGFGTVIFLPSVAVGVTIVLVVGAVNALNMVDGIDGLAGSLGFVALLGIALTAIEGGNASVLGVALALAGAVAGFLVFNLPLGINRGLRTFMGDAGSMLIGFTLSWCLVALSQNPDTPLAPVTLLWFVAVPIFDLISTATGRVRQGYSPFHADTTHFHHALIQRGLDRALVLVVLVGFAVLWGLVGAFLDARWQVPEWVSLLGFVLAGIITHVLVRGVGPTSR